MHRLNLLALSAQLRFADLREGTRDRGATAVEYGLLVALIAAVVVVSVVAMGTKVKGGFDSVNTNLP
jgi:pilus assembly protein Flp/PilA